MKLRRIFYSCFCACIICLFLGACSRTSNKASQKKILHWDEEENIQTLDPAQATDSASLTTLNSTMEGLYRSGDDSRTEPAMAKKVTNSKDKKEYTFYLRDAKWSNGDQVVAQDFVYAWQRAAAPKTNSPYAYMFKALYNGADVVNGTKPVNALGVRAVGNKKLIVKLHSNTPYLNEMLGFPAFFPLNSRIGKKNGFRNNTSVYNGPFRLSKILRKGKGWQIVKNDRYWDKKFVKLDQINFQTNTSNDKAYKKYQDGKLDRVPLNVDKVKKLKNKGTIKHRSSTVSYLQFNQNKSQFQNKDIRRSVSLAINRKKLVKKVLGDGSKIAKSGFPTGTFYYWDTEFNKQAELKRAVKSNSKQAKKLWKKGLRKEKLKGLKIILLTDNTDKNLQTARYIAKQMEAKLPNAKVHVYSTSTEEFREKATTGKFDMALTSHNAEFRDPITFLNLYTSNSPLNDGSWRNAEYDKLVNNAETRHAGEPKKRWNDMVQAEMILMNEQGVVPLYEKGETILLNRRAKGIVYKPVGIAYDFKRGYIN